MEWAFTSAQATAEEDRLDAARALMPRLFENWQPDPGAREEPRRAGRELWQTACRSSRDRLIPDDRELYWRRLAVRADMRARGADNGAIAVFERASRGLEDIRFDDGTRTRVIVTGFDPFRLDANLDQCNPSGAFALRMNGWQSAGAEIRSWLVPVRYPDFDAGLIETTLEALVESCNPHLWITVSMGRTGFDLERFPGRRRSAEGPDNLGLMSGGSAEAPAIPLLQGRELPGPEFVEFSLPAAAMVQVGGPYTVTDNRQVSSLSSGDLEATSLAGLDGHTSVRGSGGGYLSNEISYRVLNACREHNLSPRSGHIHTPRMEGLDESALPGLIAQLEKLVLAAVGEISRQA